MRLTATRDEFDQALGDIPERLRDGVYGSLISEVWKTADRDTISFARARKELISIDVNDDPMCVMLTVALTARKLTR